MGLCQVCLSLDFAAIMQADPFERYGLAEGYNKIFSYSPNVFTITRPGQPFFPYHKSLDALGKNSEICDLCRLLQHAISATLSKLQYKLHPDILDSYELFLAGLGHAQGLQVVIYRKIKETERPIYELGGGIGFFVDGENPLSTIIQGRKPSESPRSTRSLRDIDDWLLKCSTLHSHSRISTLQPTRLLRYEEKSQKVILCDLIPPLVKYAALSHCWGSVQPFALNCTTFEELRAGIPIELLPQTFQDALWLTYQLQIPYLWIYSLCIFQDDDEDWVRESSRMCDVYGNAFLTIAAARAENCHEGFLGPRLIPESINIPFQTNGTSGEVSACLLPNKFAANPLLVTDLEDVPLSKRAWATQERYLSPRTLHFTESQTYFECDFCFIAEDGRCTRTHPFVGEYTTIIGSDLEDGLQRMQTWCHIVEVYTRRSLTMKNDKLPAIADLAARFALDGTPKEDHSMSDNSYLAGLWRKDLLQDMCWDIDDRYSCGGAPSTYTAPSWSWASLKSSINYSSSWFDTTEELAVVQGAKVDLDHTDNVFGKVTGGWVHLSVIKFRPYQKDGEESLWFREGEAIFRVSVKWDSARYGLPDYEQMGKSINHEDLVAIPLGSTKKNIDFPYSLIGPYFLVLVSAKTDSSLVSSVPRYHRAGLGIALASEDQALDMVGVKTLVHEKFMREKENDRLEDIIIL